MNRTTGHTVRNVEAAVFALRKEAQDFIPTDRIQAIARQWVSGGLPDQAWREDLAMQLAADVALCMPALTGSTAFDRLAHARHQMSPLETLALGLLRRGQYRLGRVKVERSGLVWHDLAEKSVASLVTHEGLPEVPGLNAFARMAALVRMTALGDRRLMPVGLFVPLGPADVEVAQGFIRLGGRGLTNPLRCADAVFRHVVRQGEAAAPAPGPLPFRPNSDPLDALAAAWAQGGQDQEGEPEQRQHARVRQFTNVGTLVRTVVSVGIAREAGKPDLAAAYRRIALVMMETMVRRASVGSALTGLEEAAAVLEAGIAGRLYPAALRPLFDELRRSVTASRGNAADGDLDKLLQRIQALRAKTVEQGCTEQEALAAAEKVAELLDRYGLSLSEPDLRRQSCEGIGVETDRRRRAPIDDCMPTIAKFFDCRVWSETSRGGTLRYVFFGLRTDVQGALYLHDLVALAFATEAERFRRGLVYRETHTRQRTTTTTSFQIGLARGIISRLRAIRTSREAAMRGSSGRDLVPIKESVVDAEMAKLGLSLRQKAGSSRRSVLADAYHAGQAAGERFEYVPGIEGG